MGEPTIIAVEGHDQSKAIAGYCRRYHAHSVTMACQYFPDGSYQSALLVDYSVDKGRAVAIVCRELLVTLQDTIAIGDSESDISMFEQAGISVSVGTTDPNTNARATHVAPYTNGRGVAWALEHVLTC